MTRRRRPFRRASVQRLEPVTFEGVQGSITLICQNLRWDPWGVTSFDASARWGMCVFGLERLTWGIEEQEPLVHVFLFFEKKTLGLSLMGSGEGDCFGA
jgi:hypothetical protein